MRPGFNGGQVRHRQEEAMAGRISNAVVEGKLWWVAEGAVCAHRARTVQPNTCDELPK